MQERTREREREYGDKRSVTAPMWRPNCVRTLGACRNDDGALGDKRGDTGELQVELQVPAVERQLLSLA